MTKISAVIWFDWEELRLRMETEESLQGAVESCVESWRGVALCLERGRVRGNEKENEGGKERGRCEMQI